jgi:hypothetical protein
MRMSDLILLVVRRKKRWQDREDLLLVTSSRGPAIFYQIDDSRPPT